MPRATRLLFIAVAVVCVLESTAMGSAYLGYSRHYVSTANATVDGDKIEINAPETGVVSGWTLDDGSSIRNHQIVGRIRPVGSGPRPVRPVFASGSGTIAVNDVVDGSYVTAGTELATAYDLQHTYITARVDSTDIAAVRIGATVDFTADAFPGLGMTGLVEEVQNSSTAALGTAPTPGSANPANPSRVDQYIPVRILLMNTAGHTLLPGMNVNVHIARAG